MKILTTSLIAALSLPVAADIFTMKDGTTIDGTILETTAEEFKLEVNVTKSIKEQRTIKRADVVERKRVRVNEADAIFEEKIAGLTPAPPFLDLAEYDSRIKTIKDFLKDHKLTSSGSKAAPMLEELEAEREVIAAGGIKISMEPEGLIKGEDRAKDAIGIAAAIEATKFKNLVERRSYLAALRQYEVLEKSYLGTAAHREALPLMSRLVNTYATLLEREMPSAMKRKESFMMTLERLPATDKQRAMDAEEQRMNTLEAIRVREDEENQRWRTVDVQSVDSLEDTIGALEAESDRLAALDKEIAEMDDVAELYRKGWIAAGEKKKEELENILDAMDAVGAPEESINVLIDRFDPAINNPPAEEKMEDKMMDDKEMDGEAMEDKEMGGDGMQEKAPSDESDTSE